MWIEWTVIHWVKFLRLHKWLQFETGNENESQRDLAEQTVACCECEGRTAMKMSNWSVIGVNQSESTIHTHTVRILSKAVWGQTKGRTGDSHSCASHPPEIYTHSLWDTHTCLMRLPSSSVSVIRKVAQDDRQSRSCLNTHLSHWISITTPSQPCYSPAYQFLSLIKSI